MSEDKVAFVTGAGGGLGRALALRLASRGYRVGMLGRSEAPLQGVETELRNLGAKCAWRRCDVSQWPEVEAAVTELVADFVVNKKICPVL